MSASWLEAAQAVNAGHAPLPGPQPVVDSAPHDSEPAPVSKPVLVVVPEPAEVQLDKGSDAHPLDRLRSLVQVRYDCSVAAYQAAYSNRGFDAPAAWAISYLSRRMVAPAVAARPVTDPFTGNAQPRYQTGEGALPPPPKGCGKWTQAQQAWAIGNGGRSWLLICWATADGEAIGAQLRWEEPRMEVTDVDTKGLPTAWRQHKFDFPGGRDKSVYDRLVDALHSDAEADIIVIIESPVRDDSLRSMLPKGSGVSILAVGGITMAYEGRSNPSNPSDHLARLHPDVLSLTGGVAGKTVLWAPDADHRTNPACNLATQYTVESLLDAGAAHVYVVDVPEEVRHPRTNRRVGLDAGAGLDDLAAAMEDVNPGTQWLGPLLADAVEGTEYIRLYRGVGINDAQGLAEMLADRLAEKGTHRYLGDGKGDGQWHEYSRGYWGVDHADAAATIEATGCANRVFGSSKDETQKARLAARKNIESAVKRAPKTERGKADLITPEALWEPRSWAEHLPTPSGILDVKTLDLLPHTPDAMNLGVTTVDYIPGAQNDDWDRFRAYLFTTESRTEEGDVITDENGDTVWVHDAEKERMVQECFGAGLLGKTYDTGLFLVGAGGSGISTLVGAFVGVLPTAWIGSLASEELTGGHNQFVLSSIPFARFVELGEFGPSDMLNDKLWKLIAQDGSKLSVEPKFGAKYQTYPRTTMVATTNHLPGVSAAAGQDNSLRRRACIAKFTRVVTMPDSSLQDRLATREAREAILAWAVEGAHRFLTSTGRKPYRSPESVDLVEDWVTDNDRLAAFVEAHLVSSTSGYAERGDVFAAYVRWCEATGIDPKWRMNQVSFTKRLEKRAGFGSTESNGNRKADGRRGWRGWMLV